jgi:hypothetical protein
LALTARGEGHWRCVAKKNGALWLKRLPFLRHTGMAIEMLFLTPGSDFFGVPRAKIPMAKSAIIFGAELAASDF